MRHGAVVALSPEFVQRIDVIIVRPRFCYPAIPHMVDNYSIEIETLASSHSPLMDQSNGVVRTYQNIVDSYNLDMSAQLSE